MFIGEEVGKDGDSDTAGTTFLLWSVIKPYPFFMNYVNHTSTSFAHDAQDVVEIKLWGMYLLIKSTTLYNEILESSLDNGPVEKNPQTPGRITFRFSAKAWETKIKKLLYVNRIPVIVNNPFAHKFHSSQRLVG
jgi:hypothetical protein